MTGMLHHIQYQSSMEGHEHLGECAGNNLGEFSSWLLSVEKISKLMDKLLLGHLFFPRQKAAY